VGIVAAGVHHPLVAGSISDAGLFPDRQSVHVGTKSNGLPGGLSTAQTDDAGTPDSVLNLHPEALQVFGDPGSGTLLLKAELGVPVKVAADFLQPVIQPC